jgi:signal transduction histidine kinase
VQQALHEAAARVERQRAEEQLRESHEQLRTLWMHLQNMREEERTRLAHEVNDELGQTLAALKLQLTWLAGRLPSGPERLCDQAGLMLQRMDDVIHAIQRIATELRPGLLDTAGLPAALEWQARQFEQQSGIQCRVSTAVQEWDCDRQMNTTFFRIFQETLAHIFRHAHASRVDARLLQEDKQLVLEVRDNGDAPTPAQLPEEESITWLDMRERASWFGGELEVRGEPTHGTTVRVSIPLPSTPREAGALKPHENSHHRRPRRHAGGLAANPG